MGLGCWRTAPLLGVHWQGSITTAPRPKILVTSNFPTSNLGEFEITPLRWTLPPTDCCPVPCLSFSYYSEASIEATKAYQDLAAETGQSLATLALRWCRQREYMGSVIIGATSLDQLRENLEAFSMPDLDARTLRAIDQIDEPLNSAYFNGVKARKLEAMSPVPVNAKEL